MTVTIRTKKRPYVFLDVDGFEIEIEDEPLTMDTENKDGKQIIRVGEWAEDV